jgi:Fe-S-cluster containining protein
MTLPEAHELADNLGITWQQFADDYLDPRWPGKETVVVRQNSRLTCIFLDQPDGSVFGLCRIHAFKPVPCQNWRASPDKRECRQGLHNLWNLSINVEGKIEGSPEDIQCFETFIHSIT